jgi:hypothetical protein
MANESRAVTTTTGAFTGKERDQDLYKIIWNLNRFLELLGFCEA